MRARPLLLFPVLLLGACAPAQIGTSAPSAPTIAPIVRAPAPATAPENWWLLDAAEDGVFGTSTERAYRELLANQEPRRTVLVAILDSGVDIAHEDLRPNVWTNPREIPGNGVDDDGNGYIDDSNGWNFLGGPDGRDVRYDTYEIARLYAACRGRDSIPGYSCGQIEADLEKDRLEASQILQQYQSMASVLDVSIQILENHLQVDSLSVPLVASIESTEPEVRQAQQIYTQFYEMGATQRVLERGIEALSSQLEYGLNPDYDSRSIVGDDYADGTQRYYGNNHVEGPAAFHGTHVAGIVAAARNNGIGVDGIASGVQLLSVRTVPDGDERDKDVANAIRYAVDQGAAVINMSFGKGYSPGKALVDDAVRYAESKGVLLVHAAGNAAANLDTEPNFPNRYYDGGGQADLWIEVGASTWSSPDSLAAPFSNYSSSRVDVFAPGVQIFSTSPGNEYDESQGTSMAAPVVTGLAGLLLAYFPELTPMQVKEIILQTAMRFPDQQVVVPGLNGRKLPFSELSAAGGIVNTYAAVRRAAELTGRALP